MKEDNVAAAGCKVADSACDGELMDGSDTLDMLPGSDSWTAGDHIVLGVGETLESWLLGTGVEAVEESPEVAEGEVEGFVVGVEVAALVL